MNGYILDHYIQTYRQIFLPWTIAYTFEALLYFMTNLRLHNVDIHEKFLKDQALNKIYIEEKVDFEV